jgi:hypothetical protein
MASKAWPAIERVRRKHSRNAPQAIQNLIKGESLGGLVQGRQRSASARRFVEASLAARLSCTMAEGLNP